MVSSTPPGLGPALQSFYEELEKDIAHIAELLDAEVWDTPVRHLLAERFHRIKGGAGFLKLDMLYSFAAEAERFFEQHAGTSPMPTIDEKNYLHKALHVLKQEYLSLGASLSNN